jgi:2-polyprenyl-6-methoxyphenol hydroxylase-like FAD-dependent oxidoreductase
MLAQRGVSVTLVEASTSFRRIFRGEALMPSGLDALDQMGLGDVVAQVPHRRLDQWAFYLENRPLFQVQEPMELGGRSCTLISQPAFLQAVLEKAQGCEGFEFLQGTAVQDLLREGDRIVGVKLADGRELLADLVIGADGRNSLVRQRANLPLNLEPQGFDILWFKWPQELDVENPDIKNPDPKNIGPENIGPENLDAENGAEPKNVFYSMVQGRHAFGWFRGAEGLMQLGWSLHHDEGLDWKTVDWAEQIAAAAPEWLASQVRRHPLERPLLLQIQVGRCPHWSQPGLLLLGDAVHPMSPIRAQGINMALRDVVVAVNHLLPSLSQPEPTRWAAIDAALPKIQAEREPEIIQIQKLQQQEIGQAKLLRSQPALRFTVSRLAPLLGKQIRKSWCDRQIQLRQGFATVHLDLL